MPGGSGGGDEAPDAARVRRRLVPDWRALIVALLLLTGALVMLSNKLLYYPETAPLAALLADARHHRLTPWPNADQDYRGLLREPAGSARATLVLFHGNAGHAGQRDDYADQLSGLGLRVILAEYPGYGARPGSLGEASLVSDAAATLALARHAFSEPLIVAGESLGAGVAAAVAKSADASAVLLITPWDRLASIARHHYPWLPTGWLLRDRYDSVANLAGYGGRVAVVIAGRDRIVPPEYGRRLFASLGPNKRLWTIPGSGHNDWTAGVDPAWWSSLADFLLDPK